VPISSGTRAATPQTQPGGIPPDTLVLAPIVIDAPAAVTQVQQALHRRAARLKAGGHRVPKKQQMLMHVVHVSTDQRKVGGRGFFAEKHAARPVLQLLQLQLCKRRPISPCGSKCLAGGDTRLEKYLHRFVCTKHCKKTARQQSALWGSRYLHMLQVYVGEEHDTTRNGTRWAYGRMALGWLQCHLMMCAQLMHSPAVLFMGMFLCLNIPTENEGFFVLSCARIMQFLKAWKSLPLQTWSGGQKMAGALCLEFITTSPALILENRSALPCLCCTSPIRRLDRPSEPQHHVELVPRADMPGSQAPKLVASQLSTLLAPEEPQLVQAGALLHSWCCCASFLQPLAA